MNVALKYAFLVFMMLNLAEVNTQKGNIRAYRVVFMTRIMTETSKYGWPKKDSELLLDITCLEVFKPVIYPTDKTYKEINIHKCKIPNLPLATQLNNNKINLVNLQKLQFTDTLMDPPFPANYTAGLLINTLEISNPTNFDTTMEFFTPMRNLRNLVFENMETPKLPSSSSLTLESLILKHAPVKNWDNCQHLLELHIKGLTKEQIPEEWPTNCSQLKTLILENMTTEGVKHVIDSIKGSVTNLEMLVVRNCSLKQLPFNLMQLNNLEHLDLSNNTLKDNEITSQLPTMKLLKVLDLSYNINMEGNCLTILPLRTPALRELRLDGIRMTYALEKFGIREALVKLNSLETLNINGIFEEKSILQHNHFMNLKYLNIRSKNFGIYHLKLHGFPSTGAKELTVDMRGTDDEVVTHYISIGPKFVENFDPIYERRSIFWLTNKGYKLTILMDSVDCDCKNDVLHRALREFPHFLAMPDLKCSHGGLFIKEPIKNLSCRKATVNGCLRKLTKDVDYTTEVNCNNNTEKFRWPRPRGFLKLSAVGNGISTLDKAYLPDSLEWLDLRNNSIARLSSDQAASLFGNKGRRVLLAGNPIICDCDNQPLLDALHVNQSLIMDFDNLTCVNTGKHIRLVSIAELCRFKLVIPVVLVSVLSLLLLIFALLVRHYWTTLRMILYSHGCCVSCLRQTDIEEDRPYDAFLSFAHGDDEYVMKELLPQLESEPYSYRICVHYRDWAVGEWIPAQIMHSVRRSKRTIIVLSKNFMKSCWGVLEFRHANASAMADGRQRLLIIVLDDVLSEKLSPEIQGYLELNTYLKCDDPWFWEKLRYAMPHKDEQSRPKRHFFDNKGSCDIPFNDYIVQSAEELSSIEVVEVNDSSVDVDANVPFTYDNVALN